MFGHILKRLFGRRPVEPKPERAKPVEPKFANWHEFASWRVARIDELKQRIEDADGAWEKLRESGKHPYDEEMRAIRAAIGTDALEQLCLECAGTCDVCPLYNRR